MSTPDRPERSAVDPAAAESALLEQASAQYAVHFANRELVGLAPTDRRYVEHARELDEAMLNLSIGKWRLGRAIGTHEGFAASGDQGDVAAAIERFEEVRAKADWVSQSLQGGGEASPPSPAIHRPARETHGTECLFADDVPIVPSICPIVLLSGSSFQMGHQYATQIIEIYGGWIFAELARRVFSPAESEQIAAWQEQVLRHTPEIAEMARGWAAGASESGVPMTYEHALVVWTGCVEPTRELLGIGADLCQTGLGNVALSFRGIATYTGAAPDLCSGCCAWGEATLDGRLVAGASTDHDCTFQATIVAFPDEGHPFVYTPFGVNGNIPGFGGLFMAGHPGMNDSGLTYVHHGGVPYVGEASGEWGYGVRRGAGTFHLLRYADSARQALETQLGWPVGDAGRAMGTDGGFYADRDYAYVLESRTGADGRGPVLRERTPGNAGRGYEFLYSNNNPVSERAPQRNAVPEDGFEFDDVAGWYSRDQAALLEGTAGEQWRMLCGKLSEYRNRFHFEALSEANGRIDREYMYRLYSTPGTLPDGPWEEIAAQYEAGGQWKGSVAHRTNAFVSVMDPDERLYSGCIGPLRRSVQPNYPSHGYYYHDETNTSWELTLADTPAATVDAARARAQADVVAARTALSGARLDDVVRARLQGWLSAAEGHLEGGTARRQQASPDDGDAFAGQLAGALRQLTRAQVRARQVSEALFPVPTLELPESELV